jgi:hypothetical protein
LFDGQPGPGANLRISGYGIQVQDKIDSVCDLLARPETFWAPTDLDTVDRAQWYGYYGTLDLAVPFVPRTQADEVRAEEYVGGEEHDEEGEPDQEPALAPTEMQLRAFEPVQVVADRATDQLTIESVYPSELANHAHRLHDAMVNLIAAKCVSRGASVFEDPSTVDLLVAYRDLEFLVEVKSVTPRNFTSKLRYALGQVLHYDYLRSLQSHVSRRRVIAVAAQVPPQSWSVQFLNGHLDFDFLSLRDRTLVVRSADGTASQLFG